MDDWPHYKDESQTHGRSPGNGMTPAALSREPLATEGEATPGPDDWNPYDEREARDELAAMRLDGTPTSGDDPFVFDDVGEQIGRDLERLSKGLRF